MPDIVDASTRSRMMSGIKGKNTRPEIQIRKLLHFLGFRFRLHVATLPGKPDIVLPKYRVVIFVNGCFWHGHDCHLFKWPSTRVDWWRQKIYRTREIDAHSADTLLATGWRVATIWECSLKGKQRLTLQDIGERLSNWILLSDVNILEIRGDN